MALYSSIYLKNLSANTPMNESARLFSESKFKSSFDLFLSHSFLDKEVVKGLYLDLTKMGYSVYVDWIVDPYLDRNNVTKETATLVRGRLKASKSLLLAVSVNATVSKWMPWELGYVDGHTSNCAILPISDLVSPPSTYKGVEYLSLYPYITQKSLYDYTTNKLYAVENANEYATFSDWTKGIKPSYKTINLL